MSLKIPSKMQQNYYGSYQQKWVIQHGVGGQNVNDANNSSFSCRLNEHSVTQKTHFYFWRDLCDYLGYSCLKLFVRVKNELTRETVTSDVSCSRVLSGLSSKNTHFFISSVLTHSITSNSNSS